MFVVTHLSGGCKFGRIKMSNFGPGSVNMTTTAQFSEGVILSNLKQAIRPNSHFLAFGLYTRTHIPSFHGLRARNELAMRAACCIFFIAKSFNEIRRYGAKNNPL